MWSTSAVFAVDVADLALDILAQRLIAVDALPAGRGELDQHGVLALDPALGEQFGKGLEPHIDTFGVVEPVDAEQNLAGITDLGADLPGPPADVAVTSLLVELARVDGDREGAHVNGAAVDVHLTEARPHPDRTARGVRADQPSGQNQEILRTAGQLESHQVGAQ